MPVRDLAADRYRGAGFADLDLPLKQKLPQHGQNHGQNTLCSLAENGVIS
jgi:hypothetical protein